MEILNGYAYKQLEFSVKENSSANDIPVFIEPREGITERQQQASALLRESVRMTSVIMYPRISSQVSKDDNCVRNGLSALSSLATDVDFSVLENAGFESRQAFYEQGLTWASEDWVYAVMPQFGLDKNQMLANEGSAKIIDYFVRTTRDGLVNISNTHGIFNPVPPVERPIFERIV